jgi:hypothetical protein
MSRLRIYHCFEALLSSGMRIGELTSIKFNTSPAHRFIYSKLNSQQYAEIIINTEKTCKKREIYIPLETYNFFTKNIRKYRFQKFTMSKDLITVGFLKFRK